jgi:hypothetical protein
MATMKRIQTIADEIMDQVRTEYPAEIYEEALSDMCMAVRDADGLSNAEYELLREACGF